MLFVAAALVVVLAVIIVNVTSGLRKTANTKAAFASDIVEETRWEKEEETQEPTEPPLIYSELAADYQDVSGDTNISSPYAALLDVDNHKIIAGKARYILHL